MGTGRVLCDSPPLAVTAVCVFPFTPKDKKYASDKYKDIYTELSIAKAKADCDISRLKEQLKAATEALGEKSLESAAVSGYGACSGSALWVGRCSGARGFAYRSSPVLGSKQKNPLLFAAPGFPVEVQWRGLAHGIRDRLPARRGRLLWGETTPSTHFHSKDNSYFSVLLKNSAAG